MSSIKKQSIKIKNLIEEINSNEGPKITADFDLTTMDINMVKLFYFQEIAKEIEKMEKIISQIDVPNCK